MLSISGCASDIDNAVRLDTNKNDFRLHPLDVKKPSILMIEEETGTDTKPVSTPEGSDAE